MPISGTAPCITRVVRLLPSLRKGIYVKIQFTCIAVRAVRFLTEVRVLKLIEDTHYARSISRSNIVPSSSIFGGYFVGYNEIDSG